MPFSALLALFCWLIFAVPMACTAWVFTHHQNEVEEQNPVMLALMQRFGVPNGVGLMFAGMTALLILVWRFYPDGLWFMLPMFLWNAWNDIRELLKLKKMQATSQISSRCRQRG